MNQTKTTTTVAAPEKAASPYGIKEQAVHMGLDVVAGEPGTVEFNVPGDSNTIVLCETCGDFIDDCRGHVDTAPPAGKNESVWHRFKQVFDADMRDETLKDLPVNSNCGRDCVKAIAAGKRFLDAAEPSTHYLIIEAARKTCIIFYRG